MFILHLQIPFTCCRSSWSQSSWALALWSNSWRKPRRMFVKFPSNPGSDGAHRSSQRCHTCTGLRIIVNIWKQLFLSCDPPIIHGNLTCDTIFIQHNGLVKIGSVAPDAIHKNVKTFRENIKNFHFLAPEWAGTKSKYISSRAPNGLRNSKP